MDEGGDVGLDGDLNDIGQGAWVWSVVMLPSRDWTVTKGCTVAAVAIWE